MTKKSVVRLGFMFFVSVVVLSLIFALTSCGKKDEQVLNIINWADYIDESVIKDFEAKNGIKVTYDKFGDNEELLTKIKSGGAKYDLIFPTDYMVKVMISENLLAKLDMNNIPNFKYIDAKFRGLPHDKTNEFSIPYAFGFTGIGYNSNEITDTVESWNIMWDTKYNKKIIMLDDMREVFGIAFKILGYSVNDKDPEHLKQAFELLCKQKEALKKYETTMNKDLLGNGEVNLAQMWSGDLLALADEKDFLKFSIPKEGTIMFTDNMCIPQNAKHKANAEKFIDFVLLPENTAKIINAISYGMPNSEALKSVDPEIKDNPVIYPSEEMMAKIESFEDLGEYTQEMEALWTELKNK